MTGRWQSAYEHEPETRIERPQTPGRAPAPGRLRAGLDWMMSGLGFVVMLAPLLLWTAPSITAVKLAVAVCGSALAVLLAIAWVCGRMDYWAWMARRQPPGRSRIPPADGRASHPRF